MTIFNRYGHSPLFLSLQAFQELQGKVIETTQRVKIAEGQISQLKRNIAHARLTDQELASLSSDTKTYESIGRMYVFFSYLQSKLRSSCNYPLCGKQTANFYCGAPSLVFLRGGLPSNRVGAVIRSTEQHDPLKIKPTEADFQCHL